MSHKEFIMQRFSPSVILFSSFLVVSCAMQAHDEMPVLESPYLGQKPPGLTPEIFAPGIVSINGRHEGTVAFSSDFDEVYFAANNSSKTSIYFSKLEGDKWIPFKKADFTSGKLDEELGQSVSELHPSVSPDGKRLYFTAVSSDVSYTKIWYVNRLKNGWSSAIKLDSPVNDDQVFYQNQSAYGDLYYFNLSKRRNYYASSSAGSFSKIQLIEIEFGVHAFISPSQDYLVMNAGNNEDEGRNDNDIYVSFKRENGSWTRPVNLGSDVNSISNDRAPTLSPDGKYLFFSRDEEEGAREADIYWVSTDVIERLRPKP